MTPEFETLKPSTYNRLMFAHNFLKDAMFNAYVALSGDKDLDSKYAELAEDWLDFPRKESEDYQYFYGDDDKTEMMLKFASTGIRFKCMTKNSNCKVSLRDILIFYEKIARPVAFEVLSDLYVSLLESVSDYMHAAYKKYFNWHLNSENIKLSYNYIRSFDAWYKDIAKEYMYSDEYIRQHHK